MGDKFGLIIIIVFIVSFFSYKIIASFNEVRKLERMYALQRETLEKRREIVLETIKQRNETILEMKAI